MEHEEGKVEPFTFCDVKLSVDEMKAIAGLEQDPAFSKFAELLVAMMTALEKRSLQRLKDVTIEEFNTWRVQHNTFEDVLAIVPRAKAALEKIAEQNADHPR